ncbi:large conductance mechanosensitive channel protein MscL [Halalkalibacter nanhaiisediminis]|uniref:Large-conductance mechanosensitive channel n=1 Tax=Halalkalibacter nanhaiisediminis TaxID=688079 RepID=A0A562QQT4_9BACI|nr:large conductance mechanosensitive channel protein MscL [Halalkalibacter nanhaiisediminis]TWI59065.1 large conductance mechanosensitive channel [Halalkalibacter nanhaiisediminis]
MLKEFKEFAMRGNVFDLAIAVVLGTAFNQIVSSLVEDMIMPLVGLIIGGIDFGSLQIVFGDAVIHYGVFIQSIVDFVLIAFSIFLFIKLFNKFKRKEEKKEEVKAPALTKEEVLLTEIRDLLKTQSKS